MKSYPIYTKRDNSSLEQQIGGIGLKRIISIALIAMMLLSITTVVFAAENASQEVSEKESTAQEQAEKTLPATQKVTEEVKEEATKAKEEAAEKTQPGFDAIFAAAGLLAVAFIALKRRS
jgi:hypothetical protein